MTKTYIAGPMTGLPENNFPAFFEAERLLRDIGRDPVNPAFGEKPGLEHHEYLRADLRLLLDCDEIALLPGWRKSEGATLEAAVAIGAGLRVLCFDSEGELWDVQIFRSKRWRWNLKRMRKEAKEW